MSQQSFTWPLMHNNISREDLDVLIDYLQQDDPRLTHGPQVRAFEEAWSSWLGVRHSIMVNSGASANDLTMLAMRELQGHGDVILPPLGWVSDVAAILHAGLRPTFVDIDPVTLGASQEAVAGRLSDETRAVLVIHILGLNALTSQITEDCQAARVPLIEDVCESHGAVHQGRMCGSIGFASNFSFYYAHHLTTIEGGAICTNDDDFADVIRMMRSHGLVREAKDARLRSRFRDSYPDLNPEFIFAHAGHNNRPTELNGVLGLNQLPRLDTNIEARRRTFRRFMAQVDPNKYRNDFDVESSSNYAFIVVLQEPDWKRRDAVEQALRFRGIEFRRGLSGGGNQLRQPYVRRVLPDIRPEDFPNTEHVHHFGWYVGNYPGVTDDQVDTLCAILNTI